MEIEIGKKLQQARKDANLTQEQAAELLHVSRQTISNWENEKSYPDILSVIQISDLYHVSLDVLLKGEEKMNNYYEYLADSTNVHKSNEKKGKIFICLSYLLIWGIAMIAFWCFLSDGDEMGYSLMYLWGLLPITTLVESYLIAKAGYWRKSSFFVAIVFGMMYMFAEYGTFSLANMMSFGHWNVPEFSMILVGALISGIGLGIGTVVRKKKYHEE